MCYLKQCTNYHLYNSNLFIFIATSPQKDVCNNIQLMLALFISNRIGGDGLCLLFETFFSTFLKAFVTSMGDFYTLET